MLLKHVPVFLYSVTMLIFQIKRIISLSKKNHFLLEIILFI